jgi:hypothetical protein
VNSSERLGAAFELFAVRLAVNVDSPAEASAASVARPVRLGADEAQVWQRVAG